MPKRTYFVFLAQSLVSIYVDLENEDNIISVHFDAIVIFCILKLIEDNLEARLKIYGP